MQAVGFVKKGRRHIDINGLLFLCMTVVFFGALYWVIKAAVKTAMVEMKSLEKPDTPMDGEKENDS
jgi:hypothetical protein